MSPTLGNFFMISVIFSIFKFPTNSTKVYRIDYVNLSMKQIVKKLKFEKRNIKRT